MATKSDTFERKEKKYLLTAEQARAVKEAIGSHMRLDDYGETRIDSLYLDTIDRSLICRSLEKPLYKEKLRVRSYGPFSEAETVYVEIKKKFKGIVYKRRVRMSRQGARDFLEGKPYDQAQREYQHNEMLLAEDLAPGKIQISREISAFMNRYEELAPSMLISCFRQAFCPIDPSDEDCVDRITFDRDITAIDLMDATTTVRDPVISHDQVIMEVKCAGGYPMWLTALLSSLGAYPRSFSKYGNAYKRCLARRGSVSVRSCRSGKLSVQRIRTQRPLEDKDAVLLRPSKGYGADTQLRLVS